MCVGVCDCGVCVWGVCVCVFPRFYLFNGLSRPIACKELNSKILLILKQDWRNMKIVKFSNFEFQISKFDNFLNFWTLFITQREWLKKQIIWDVSTRRAPTTLRVYGLMIGQNKPYQFKSVFSFLDCISFRPMCFRKDKSYSKN